MSKKSILKRKFTCFPKTFVGSKTIAERVFKFVVLRSTIGIIKGIIKANVFPEPKIF